MRSVPKCTKSQVLKVIWSLKATANDSVVGESRIAPGGMFDHGAHEEDDPVTWEIHTFPRADPVEGEPKASPPNGARVATRVRRFEQPHPKRCRNRSNPSRGRPKARGTRAEADEGVEVGWPNMSYEVGKPGGAGSRRSKGGQC